VALFDLLLKTEFQAAGPLPRGRDLCQQREQWEEKFPSLLAFKRRHGHCKVRQRDGKLGKWVSYQWKCRKKGTLKPREARLEAVGFFWNGRPSNERPKVTVKSIQTTKKATRPKAQIWFEPGEDRKYRRPGNLQLLILITMRRRTPTSVKTRKLTQTLVIS
jgi:hypothetical protein